MRWEVYDCNCGCYLWVEKRDPIAAVGFSVFYNRPPKDYASVTGQELEGIKSAFKYCRRIMEVTE